MRDKKFAFQKQKDKNVTQQKQNENFAVPEQHVPEQNQIFSQNGQKQTTIKLLVQVLLS